MSLLDVPMVKPHQLKPGGVQFLPPSGTLLRIVPMGISFLRFLSVCPQPFTGERWRGKNAGDQKKNKPKNPPKVAQNIRRRTFRGVTVSFTATNAKIGNQVLLGGLENTALYFSFFKSR